MFTNIFGGDHSTLQLAFIGNFDSFFTILFTWTPNLIFLPFLFCKKWPISLTSTVFCISFFCFFYKCSSLSLIFCPYHHHACPACLARHLPFSGLDFIVCYASFSEQTSPKSKLISLHPFNNVTKHFDWSTRRRRRCCWWCCCCISLSTFVRDAVLKSRIWPRILGEWWDGDVHVFTCIHLETNELIAANLS